MINPWKDYKAKPSATIIKIDDPNAYIPYLTIRTDDGQEFSGDIKRAYTNWKSLKVGQRVNFWCQFSITSDKMMVSKITVKRRAA